MESAVVDVNGQVCTRCSVLFGASGSQLKGAILLKMIYNKTEQA